MSPKRRAYRFGYLRAMRLARKELHAMAARWDDDLAELEDGLRSAHEQTARSIDAELDGVRAEMQAARAEFLRLKAVEQGIAAERDLDAWLN